MDAVTQFELVATCERLSEACLLPVLRELLAGFPFVILGFHNGSEYINRKVSKMLDKRRIEFAKSRPRHSNDNALAETKNGAIVRKHLGYGQISQRFAGSHPPPVQTCGLNSPAPTCRPGSYLNWNC